MATGDTPFSEGRERKKHVLENVNMRRIEEKALWIWKEGM